MLKVGDPFPEFSLLDQDGKTHTLAGQQGRRFVVYIYPKDDTPGCTIQGKEFSAAQSKFEKAGVTVFGLSADDVASHRSFCDKFGLSHILLADPQEKLLTALGLEKKEWKGMSFWERTTFLVDSSGKVVKVYANVDPKNHADLILQDFLSM
jgi:peroxiredoxin Q/BCP